VRLELEEGRPIGEMEGDWEEGLPAFKEKRRGVLLYS
jgi:hypothetical protein